MSDDIGPGDVVEALHDMPGCAYSVRAGDRDVVLALGSDHSECEQCGATGGGIVLKRFWQHPGDAWCVNHWRKIGGSQSDTVTRFAHHLSPADKPKVRA